MTAPPVVLTIAGSDSGGCAGIQADLKAFAANGTFGTSAITAITAQNTLGVQLVHPLPVEVVIAQVRSVVDDLRPVAVKTGMLGTAEMIAAVAELAAQGLLPNLVVDPVMVATSGDRLLDADAEAAYLSDLFPHAAVITPNAEEAAVLTGLAIADLADAHAAATRLAASGASTVVVKGGHLRADQAVDVFWDGNRSHELTTPWLDATNTHGTGCSFAAAIAAQLGHGESVRSAVEAAKAYVAAGISGGVGWRLGGGPGPIDHFGWSTTA